MPENKLTIVARILAKEGQSDFIKSELTKLIAPTLAEEGCINYDLHQDNHNEHFFMFYENWTSRTLWQAHNNSAHIAAYRKATEGRLAEVIINEMTQVE